LTPSPRTDLGSGFDTPAVGAPVELFRNNEWCNGWVVANASNMGSIRAAKLGSPNVLISNLRWGLDVRLCQSGSQEPEPTDSFDF
tara:strand:+ start:88 stop:342 length:255 start_codon:yes stop_codon:yes gene_type:complete